MVRIESMYTRWFSSSGFALRLAGVIHEARLVAIDAGIDHGVRVDDEQEGVVVARILVVVTAIRFPVRHALAQVRDDACAARMRRAANTPRPCRRESRTRQRRLPRGGLPRSHRHRRADRRMMW